MEEEQRGEEEGDSGEGSEEDEEEDEEEEQDSDFDELEEENVGTKKRGSSEKQVSGEALVSPKGPQTQHTINDDPFIPVEVLTGSHWCRFMLADLFFKRLTGDWYHQPV